MKNFVQGWYRMLLGKTDDEAKRKAAICDACPHIVRDSLYEDFINDKIVEVSGSACAKCSCPIGAVIRSNKKCPVNKF